jgi:hypothetical protein
MVAEPREDDQKIIEQLRQLLLSQFTVLNDLQNRITSHIFILAHSSISDSSPAAFDDLDDEDSAVSGSVPEEPTNDSTTAESLKPPETRPLSIPSNWLNQNNPFRAVELDLRVKQAEKCLQALRDTIADKSFQYSHVIRVAPRKGVRTRARGAIAKLNWMISYHARVYERCRNAMTKLGAEAAILSKYPILLKHDLKSSTALLNPNDPGSTHLTLSWIWRPAVSARGESSAALRECKQHNYLHWLDFTDMIVTRVHWIRARAQKHRWHEEFTLTGYEMEWTVRYYLYQAKLWVDRGTEAARRNLPGAAAYASRKVALWQDMSTRAQKTFMSVNNTHPSLVG